MFCFITWIRWKGGSESPYTWLAVILCSRAAALYCSLINPRRAGGGVGRRCIFALASPYSTWYINYPATGLINPLLTRVHRTSGQFWGLHLQLLRIKKISILAELLLHSIHILAPLFTGPVLIDDPSIYMLCIHTFLLQLLLHFTFDILNVYCTILCPALVRIHVFMCYRTQY